MHFYLFHIGDYAAHTGHLTLLEDLAYRRLLDKSYLQEKPLPAHSMDCARLIGMRDHTEEVDAVLAEFFDFDEEEGYTHGRVDLEISKAGRLQELRSKGGKATAAKRALQRRSSAAPIEHQRRSSAAPAPLPKTQDPIPNTQDPVPTTAFGSAEPVACAPVPVKGKPKKEPAFQKPDDIDADLWRDFLAYRKAKRAPVTDRVMKLTRASCEKAGMSMAEGLEYWISNGQTGFFPPGASKRKQPAKTDFANTDYRQGGEQIRNI